MSLAEPSSLGAVSRSRQEDRSMPIILLIILILWILGVFGSRPF